MNVKKTLLYSWFDFLKYQLEFYLLWNVFSLWIEDLNIWESRLLFFPPAYNWGGLEEVWTLSLGDSQSLSCLRMMRSPNTHRMQAYNELGGECKEGQFRCYSESTRKLTPARVFRKSLLRRKELSQLWSSSLPGDQKPRGSWWDMASNMVCRYIDTSHSLTACSDKA